MSRRLGWIGGFTAAALVSVYPLPAGHMAVVALRRRTWSPTRPACAADRSDNLVNAWGMSRGREHADLGLRQRRGRPTLYSGASREPGEPGREELAIRPDIPGGAPTGQANNDVHDQATASCPGTTTAARFIFIGEDGDLSAWAGGGATAATLISHTDGAIYKGLALAHSAFGPLLLAANFGQNRIDVFDGQFKPVTDDRLFQDRAHACELRPVQRRGVRQPGVRDVREEGRRGRHRRTGQRLRRRVHELRRIREASRARTACSTRRGASRLRPRTSASSPATCSSATSATAGSTHTTRTAATCAAR